MTPNFLREIGPISKLEQAERQKGNWRVSPLKVENFGGAIWAMCTLKIWGQILYGKFWSDNKNTEG